MNRRGFITGLIAGCVAPAIVRPGLLMPIKPSLVPGYRLVQLGVDFNWNERGRPSVERLFWSALDELQGHVEKNGLVWHNEALPSPPGAVDVKWHGLARAVSWYDLNRCLHFERVDVLCRDYSVAA